MKKIIIPYNHESADLGFIYLAVTSGRTPPAENDWIPAYRDIVDGERVVWVKIPDEVIQQSGFQSVWLSDRNGPRRIKTTRRLRGV